MGPLSIVESFDQSKTDGPYVRVINNKDLQVDWEGAAIADDEDGWTIAATGLGLCFTPAIKAGVCITVAGLATEVFDTEVFWAYRRSAVFRCEKDENSWKVKMSEQERFEKYEDNDWFDFYTKYD